MYVKSFVIAAAISAVFGFGAFVASASITIPTVTIGNPDNAADPTTGFGSVAYTYNIGTTEVTNAQYAAFLNATAASDPFNLYNTNMGTAPYGGITRAGSPGSYTYALISGRENHPVSYVSFWDATRFANWLHNGQGSGDTETGAYTLTAAGIGDNTITRNSGAVWAVTSEDEWYKAAYHQPAGQGGDVDSYWLFPTRSNSITTAQANYDGVIGNTRPVGSYDANYYGTFDMGGNVWEWNEAILGGRGVRGGYFNTFDVTLRADSRPANTGGNDPTFENFTHGFRVSEVVVCNLPTISAPLGSAICPGQPIALAATAPGATSYQWLKDLVEIPGATLANFEISSATAIDAGSYRVRAAFPCGTRTSNPIDLTLDTLSLTLQPTSVSACPTSTVNFSANGTAGSALTYQWQVQDAGAPGGWLDIAEGTDASGVIYSGVFNSTLSITPDPSFDAADSKQYRCIISSDCASITSNPASLTVLSTSGSVSSDPVSTFLCEGFTDPATFTAAVTGGPLRWEIAFPSGSGNWEPLSDGDFFYSPWEQIIASVSGSQTNTLLITPFFIVPIGEWSADIRAVPAGEPCPGAPSAVASLETFSADNQRCAACPCPADFNCDGTSDFFDYLDFVDAFSSQLPAADFNGDSVIDFFDYLDFVDAFSAGC